MLKRLRVASFAVTLLVVAQAQAKPASEATPAQVRAAADAFDRGRDSYALGDMAVAADAFEQADSRAGSPIALEYAIRARDRAGQLDRAATLAALAQRRYPADVTLEQLVNDVLARARAQFYELTIECSEPCEVVIDGKLLHGAGDFERVVFLSPSQHVVRAGFPGGHHGSKNVEATVAGRGTVRFDPPAEPPPVDETTLPKSAEPTAAVAEKRLPSTDRARETSGWSPAVFWVGAGVTAALGAVTIWSGLDTAENPGEDAVRAACRDDLPTCDSLYEDGRSRQTRTNVLLGVTAGLGLGTILVGALATDWGGNDAVEVGGVRAHRGTLRSKSRARLVPWLVVGDGALVGAEGSF